MHSFKRAVLGRGELTYRAVVGVNRNLVFVLNLK